jgi:hypothetical protein
MTSIKSFLLLCIMSLTLFGSSQDSLSLPDHYKTRHFDCVIFPASYEELWIGGERYTPTRHEIEFAESILRKELKVYKWDLYDKEYIEQHLSIYCRQYFGHLNRKGEKELYIFFVCKDSLHDFEDDFREKDFWVKHLVVVEDGGKCYWRIKFNIPKKELFDMSINGIG